MSVLRLKDRVAFITGGGSGIGAAIARLFAQQGARVVVAGRRDEPLAAIVRAIEETGGQAACTSGDVTRLDDVQKMIHFTVDRYGSLDTLVNNAGVIRRTEKVEETTREQWDWLVDTNLKGVFHTTKLCLPFMMQSTRGTIVNIASINAFVAAPGYATYCATKGGVVAYTRAVALQYAEYGIRANAISPGMVHTPMAYVDRPNFEEVVDDIVERFYPLKRVGLPEDVAYAALYLASDEASWITGQNLVVDGGFSIK
jgi:NAD(P)-dependent dehydrogenase (short-subunit alcohol dehydrogenase family)